MKIIISNSSQAPIYEQIIKQIKSLIADGQLKEGDGLPSVRALAAELRISALTVKKAYDALEQSGIVTTVHGKGSYVASGCGVSIAEEGRVEVEAQFEQAVKRGRALGMSDDELTQMLSLILEEKPC